MYTIYLEKDNTNMKTIFTHYLKPFYNRILYGFIIKFIGTIMDLLIPWILAYMIDSIIPTKNRTLIYLWGGGMITCSFLAVTLNIIANRMASRVASETTEIIRCDLFHTISYLSSTQTDRFTKPSLISRLTSDTYNVHNMIGRMQRLGVRAPILLIGGICVTLTLDPVLSFVLICILPFITLLMIYVSQKSIPLYAKLQQSNDSFIRDVREAINGMRVIKALSKGDYERDKFNIYNSEVTDNEKKTSTTMALVSPCMNLLLNIGLILVIVVGALRVNAGLTQVGKILAFLTYFTIILNAMLNISRMFILFSKAAASADRIMEVIECDDLDIDEEFTNDRKTIEEDIDINSNKSNQVEACSTYVESDVFIEFSHVWFSYQTVSLQRSDSTIVDESYALHDINFRLKRGETLGILGATGSGKSTILQLLLRFYSPTKGYIRINGIDIKEIPLKVLREKFGIVFQNDILFQDTIEENIRLGRELSPDDIKEALTYSKADEFVTDLQSYLTIKGANLSGGQKQRILIARALAAKPEILLLDDSSSALDYKTDALLREQLREHFAQTTKIIIAQRISSIMNAEHILVMDDGEMIDYGTHEQLLSRCSIYQDISKSQMGEQKTKQLMEGSEA
jgi:ATP-binding cassette, subfamily B, multidrug efflux pump